MTRDELTELLTSKESFRIERTVSTTDKDKFGEAVCAFANDMPDSGKPGYLLVGVRDDGSLSGLKATDELLKKFSSIRSDGNILPIPVLAVEAASFTEGDVIVVEVQPSDQPPVRYRGRTWIRIGPRRDIATPAEETILAERKARSFKTFDARPCFDASLDDLDLETFARDYLPKAVDAAALVDDDRPIERKMEALRLFNGVYGVPTNAAVLLFGKDPQRFFPGAYIQYVAFNGLNNAAEIVNEHPFRGGLLKVLPQIDIFIETAIAKKRPVPVSALREKTVFDYPKWAIRELVMNAIMHRDYEGNAPIKFYQYADRLEIVNHGGLYGRARPENFPHINDYRNPIIAEAMKVLGYVNCYNRGIETVQSKLVENGNGEAAFSFRLVTAFEAKVALSHLENEKPHFDGQEPSIGGEKPLIEGEKPSIEPKKPHIGIEEPHIDGEKLHIEDVVRSLKLTRPTESHMLMLNDKLAKSEFFGRTDVCETTGLADRAASDLLVLMLKHHLIEPVVGHGKGKYRFVTL